MSARRTASTVEDAAAAEPRLAVLQGETFDPAGAYVRRWVPGLARLDGRSIYAPRRAPAEALSGARVALGETYRQRIVDHAAARARALAARAEARRTG